MLEIVKKQHKNNPLRVDEVTLDGWSDSFFVREMDAEAMSSFFKVNAAKDEDSTFSARSAAAVIVLHLCDPDGSLLLTAEGRADGVEDLESLRFADVTKLFTACLVVSGLAQSEIEDAAGN